MNVNIFFYFAKKIYLDFDLDPKPTIPRNLGHNSNFSNPIHPNSKLCKKNV